MWECKECGGNSFEYVKESCMEFRGRNFDEYCKVDDGTEIDNENVSYEYYECEDCGDSSNDLKKIAKWVE